MSAYGKGGEEMMDEIREGFKEIDVSGDDKLSFAGEFLDVLSTAFRCDSNYGDTM